MTKIKSGLAQVSESRKLHPRDMTKRDIVDRVHSLKASLHKNLKQVALYVSKGQWDKAAMVCDLVSRKRLQLQNMADELGRRLAEEAKPAIDQHRPSKVKVQQKIKRYPRWSDK